MPQIRLITDLRDTKAISGACHACLEPFYAVGQEEIRPSRFKFKGGRALRT